MFGSFIGRAREKAGRSIEQTAALAGMSAAQWSGVEAGAYLPITRQQLQVVADAVDTDSATMAQIVFLCREAWGLQ
jgi:transcriptional regulator with XRE-family HTH domain